MSEPQEADAPVDGMEPEPDAQDLSGEGNGKSRERSQIKFPYTDIDDAVQVASKIKNVHGTGPVGLDQLAAALGGTSVKSGSFRTKVATASTFGAIKSSRGSVELTDLGQRLADEDTRAAAMVEAFLHVPLYQKIYERYQGRSLPEDAGLENDIRGFGVVANQTDRARQALQRSAEKAGFFWGGRSRLVLPPRSNINGASNGSSEGSGGGTEPEPEPKGGGENMAESPLLKGLWGMLPTSGDFPAEKRERWFKALAVNLDMVYGDVELDVTVRRPGKEAPRGGASTGI